MAFDATSIDGLDQSVPAGTDSKSFGDDNLREIKKVLQTSFPNNPPGDVYEGTLSQLTDLAAGQTLPRDMIIMWAGNQTTEPNGPAGWTICDGRVRKEGGGNAPDLTNVFIHGAQPDTSNTFFTPHVGDIGGNNEIDIRDIGTGNLHKYTTVGHSLLVTELPVHHHAMFGESIDGSPPDITDGNTTAYEWDESTGGQQYTMKTIAGSATRGRTSDRGSNVSHTHQFSIDGSSTFTGANIPRFYALLFLIKD